MIPEASLNWKALVPFSTRKFDAKAFEQYVVRLRSFKRIGFLKSFRSAWFQCKHPSCLVLR